MSGSVTACLECEQDGANTAVFSVINQVVLRPLPVARSSEPISLNGSLGGNLFPTLSYPNYRDIRDRNQVLAGLAAYRVLPARLGLPGTSRRLWGYLVTGNYFEMLGVHAARGRLLTPADDLHPGAHPVAVLSYDCWQQHFGGDPAAVGRKLEGGTGTLDARSTMNCFAAGRRRPV